VRVTADWPTAWAKKDKSGYFTLGQLWLWLSSTDLTGAEYFKKTRDLGLTLIPTQEREAITLYFAGGGANLDELDERVRPDTLLKRSDLKAGRVKGSTSQEQMIRKRDSKMEEKAQRRAEKRLVDFLHEGERKTAGKSNCLQAQGRSFLQVLQLAYTMTGQAEKAKEA